MKKFTRRNGELKQKYTQATSLLRPEKLWQLLCQVRLNAKKTKKCYNVSQSYLFTTLHSSQNCKYKREESLALKEESIHSISFRTFQILRRRLRKRNLYITLTFISSVISYSLLVYSVHFLRPVLKCTFTCKFMR